MAFIYRYIFLGIFLFSSCSHVRYIDIQVMLPSQNTLPKEMQQCFVLRTINFLAANDSILNSEFLRNFYTELERELKNAPVFESKKISLLSLSEYRDIFSKTSFNDKMNIDVLTLDSIFLTDTIFIEKEISSDINDLMVVNEVIKHSIVYNLLFTLENMAFLNNKQILKINDTIIWSKPKQLLEFPQYLDIAKRFDYKELCQISADKFVKSISPFWYTEERVIFYGNSKNLRKGYKQFVLNNLDLAIVKWSAAYHTGKPLQASWAAYNLALTYEIADNLLSSKYWIDNAITIRNDSIYQQYRRIILKRIEDKSKIKQQL